MVVGYFTIAWMIYLIIVTARTVPQIWDPYNILEISRVSQTEVKVRCQSNNCSTVFKRATDQKEI